MEFLKFNYYGLINRIIFIIVLCIFLSSQYAAAFCPKEKTIANIEFKENSSYLLEQDKQLLDSLLINQVRESILKSGYLLLEFSIDKYADEAEVAKYNLWLANRRIERVKSYLNRNQQLPIISRVLTSGDNDIRILSIFLCSTEK